MLVVSAILTSIFLSPVLFGILIGACIALYAGGKRKAATWFLAGTLAVFLALSTGPVKDFLLHPLEYRYPPYPPSTRVDAIVVLGGGIMNGAPDEGGQASLPGDALKRTVYACTLFRRLGVPIIVSGGIVWKARNATPEACVEAATLARLGVSESLIIREGRSRSTWENAREVSRILASRGDRRVALVTSAYHMPRAVLAFLKAGVSTVPAPTDYKSVSGAAFIESLPNWDSLTTCFKAFREYLGIALYALRR
jgi:uncharacterized SAM-binding protein YcdF (DUF218 family)